MREAVIVSGARTAVGRAPRGTLRASRPDDMAAAAIGEAVGRAEGLEREDVEDVIIGCAMPEGTQGYNVARLSSLLAGMPDTVPAQTVNRFCSSGLQTIAMASERIIVGNATTIVAGGDGAHVFYARDAQFFAQSEAHGDQPRGLHGHGPYRRAGRPRVRRESRGPGRVRPS